MRSAKSKAVCEIWRCRHRLHAELQCRMMQVNELQLHGASKHRMLGFGGDLLHSTDIAWEGRGPPRWAMHSST